MRSLKRYQLTVITFEKPDVVEIHNTYDDAVAAGRLLLGSDAAFSENTYTRGLLAYFADELAYGDVTVVA